MRRKESKKWHGLLKAMGVQLVPALEGYERDYFFIHDESDWKSVSFMLEWLDEVAEQIGVEPYSSFINSTRDESPFDDEELEEFEQVAELINGTGYYEGSELWSIEPKWFLPEQGLITVREIANYLRSLQPEWEAPFDEVFDLPEGVEDCQGAMHELEAIEKILIRAQQESKRFRVCISG